MSTLLAAGLLDELEAVVDDGEGGEAEEVHLEQAHFFDGLHVVGGDDFVVLGSARGTSSVRGRGAMTTAEAWTPEPRTRPSSFLAVSMSSRI